MVAGFLGALAGFGRFFFTRGFAGGGELHGTDKEPGEQTAAEERIPEEFPRLGVAGGAFGQRGEPAEECLGVFEVLEGIEKPRRSVGGEVEDDRAGDSTAEQRTKEIGIRKVMGASVAGLVSLMSKDFSRLVIIAFLISAPLAWLLLNSFLERYPYRIEIQWWIFPLTGLASLVFALMIVSTQALRVAHANPATSLRNE